jgi:hypothetical protein
MIEVRAAMNSSAALLEPSPLRTARGRGLGEGALWLPINRGAPLTPALSPDGFAVGGEGAKAA